MDSNQLWSEVILPNMQEVRSSPDDMRAAINLIMSLECLLSAFHSELMNGGKFRGSDDRLRGQLSTESEVFRLVRDSAAALKHGELTNTETKRSVRHAHLVKVEASAWNDGGCWDDDGVWSDTVVAIAYDPTEASLSTQDSDLHPIAIVSLLPELEKFWGAKLSDTAYQETKLAQLKGGVLG